MTDTPRNRAFAYAEKCADPEKLARIAANAADQGDNELERVVLLKLYSIMPKFDPRTIEHDVWQSIYALEGELKRERGKTILLARTRQKIVRDGEPKTVSDLVNGKPSKGFAMLIERGMPERTFEALTLRHPLEFDDETRRHATQRLTDAGVIAP